MRFKNSLSDPNKNNLDLHNWFFSMEIVKNSLGSLFLKKMFVPDYQRGYSWSLDNVEDLFTDLSNYMKAKDDDEYLFGQIIIHEETIDGNTRLNIVDGQQRLATVTIFVCAVRDILNQYSNEYDYEIPQSIRQIINNVVGIYDEFIKDLRLTLNIENRQFFLNYIQLCNHDYCAESDSDKLIKDAYNLLYQKLDGYVIDKTDPRITFNSYFDILNALTSNFIVSYVKTTTLSKAFVIFETLNYRGQPLQVSDLLKNYYYSMIDDDHDYLKSKWLCMIDETNRPSKCSSSQYIRYYWNSFNPIARAKDLYGSIVRSQNNNPNFDVYDFLEDLIRCSELYVSMVDFKKKSIFDDESRSILKLMREANASSFFPLIIAIYRKQEIDRVKPVLKAIASMILRNQVLLKMTANSNEIFFAGLASDYTKNDKTTIDDLIKKIYAKAEDDGKIKSAFKEFSPNQYLAKQLLFMIYGLKNPGLQIKESDVHIEHIMPKNKDKWKISEDIHKIYHKRFGNMILLYKTENLSIKNSPYDVKREAYIKSKIEDTRNIGLNNIEWTKDQIESRQDELFKDFINAWPKIT